MPGRGARTCQHFVGTNRSVLYDGRLVSGAQYNARGHHKVGVGGNFNTLSCSKLRIVLSLIEEADVSVVFCDADNVFKRDPFALGALH